MQCTVEPPDDWLCKSCYRRESCPHSRVTIVQQPRREALFPHADPSAGVSELTNDISLAVLGQVAYNVFPHEVLDYGVHPWLVQFALKRDRSTAAIDSHTDRNSG